MNINRIFNTEGVNNYDDNGEIRLSQHYRNDENQKFIVIKAVNPVDASLIMLFGFPFSISKDQAIKPDGEILSKHIMYVFGLSEDELKQFSMPDFLSAMNYVVDKFNETEEE